MTRPRTALIFGISGQDGAYLSQQLLARGYAVHGTSRDAEMSSFAALESLAIRDKVTLHSAVPTDFRSVVQTISRTEPDEIYNLSGQSSVGLSFEEPVETLHSISIGTLNMLESIRFLDRSIRFYNAGSSECFGNTGAQPADEDTPFRPRSPYAVAKATAHWAVVNYRESYDLFACSGILFNHESPLRPARFVTRKIVDAAARIASGADETLTLGNIAVRRDWGWAPEYVDAMWRMLQQDTAEDFVIATGRTHSLEEFVATAFARFDLDWRDHVTLNPALHRPADIDESRGDPVRAERALEWRATRSMPDVVAAMADAEAQRRADSGAS
jgi:GDPmannose 4,6-dehydratase